MGPCSSIPKFVNAYLSNQIHLEAKTRQGATTFHALKNSYPQCDMSSYDGDIFPKKMNFLTMQAKFDDQYFSNQRYEIVKKLFLCNNLRYFIQMS